MRHVHQISFMLICFVLSAPILATDMKGNMSMDGDMNSGMGRAVGKDTGQLSHGMGVIQGIDPGMGQITISHQPIKELNWPAMTMAFKVTTPKLLNGLVVGQHVSFDFRENETLPVITSIQLMK